MNLEEYEKVRDFTYLEYCKYLQDKYGLSECAYYNKNFNKNSKVTRTKEGLAVHHLDEDKMVMLSTKEVAMEFPYEWQTPEHLVYCDLLEHLLLHVLICYYPSPEKQPNADVGIGGAVNYLIPELNDMFSGWETRQEWRKAQHDRIKDDGPTYLAIIDQLIPYLKKRGFKKKILHSSMSDQYGGWDKRINKPLYKCFNKIWGWFPFW